VFIRIGLFTFVNPAPHSSEFASFAPTYFSSLPTLLMRETDLAKTSLASPKFSLGRFAIAKKVLKISKVPSKPDQSSSSVNSPFMQF